VRAVRFDVTVPGFLIARSLGRVSEAAVFGRLSGLRLAQVADTPLPGPKWASLRVLGCGICGSDLGNLSYESSPSMEPFGSFPATLGHEILAVVESVGSGVSRAAPGDRVAVDPMLSCEVRGHSGEAICPSCRVGRHGTCEMAGEEGALILAGGRPLSPGLTIGYHRDLPGG
jgi:threonine dehydrogenase-like Zn-dependent dehydrogenase